MAQPKQSLRILFCGMAGATSIIALDALLAAGVGVCGVVLGAPRVDSGEPIERLLPPAASPLPIANPFAERGPAQIAFEHGLPAFVLRQPNAPAALAALARLRPDAACVACFPYRIPVSLLALPPLGWLNMHPSLLPAHRGPEPLFWTFRAGEPRTGVTIHFMDQRFDTGDIAAQGSIDLPDGFAGAAAERACAALGGQLMAEVLLALAAGTSQRNPQPPGGSYEPAPATADFRLDPSWPARRAFNFMRGTADWRQPYPIAAGGADVLLVEALSFDASGQLGAALERAGDIASVHYAPGVLRARVARVA
jgi:methionyl-tRNA formyltransferase